MPGAVQFHPAPVAERQGGRNEEEGILHSERRKLQNMFSRQLWAGLSEQPDQEVADGGGQWYARRSRGRVNPFGAVPHETARRKARAPISERWGKERKEEKI